MASRSDLNLNKNDPKRIPIYAWILLAGLLAWGIWAWWPRASVEQEIPYSVFLQQVKSGNVASVTISGSDINGTLNKPVLLPVTSGEQTLVDARRNGPPTIYTTFHTQFPEVVGDPNLVSLLNSHNVQIIAQSAAKNQLGTLSRKGLPLLFLAIAGIWIGTRTWQNPMRTARVEKSKTHSVPTLQATPTFENVAGLQDAKQEVRQVIDYLRNSAKYHLTGGRMSRGILLVGPTGTGKTLFTQAVAGEAGVPCITISPGSLREAASQSGNTSIQNLFQQAVAQAPAILFVDDLEQLAHYNTSLYNKEEKQDDLLNQLLVEMDQLSEQQEVIIFAATRHLEAIPQEFMQPKRFERLIFFNLPDRKERERILGVITKGMSLEPNVNLGIIVRTTTGFSAADLETLCNHAALNAAKENRAMVSMTDFEEALDQMLLDPNRKLLLDESERRAAAYHEAGHALIAWLNPVANLVQKISILPQVQSREGIDWLAGDESSPYSKEYLLACLSIMLGGRAAEENATGEVTTSAEKDLVQASRLARRMVTRWGMGPMGPVALDTREEQLPGGNGSQSHDYSEETAVRIDRAVQELLETRYSAVREQLLEHQEPLDRLAEVLLQEETISRVELTRLLGPRPVKQIEKEAGSTAPANKRSQPSTS